MPERKKILVVDDSAMIRRIIKEELKAGDFIVEEADSGDIALDMIQNGMTPDLMTIDIEMQGLNGFELFETLSDEEYGEYFSDLPDKKPAVIFITTRDRVRDRKKGYKLGATDFIPKPFHKGQLLSRVNKILYPENMFRDLLALVVDDSFMARAAVKKALEPEGINIIEAEDGVQALEILCKRMSEIDILIVDLMMPVMEGDELVEKARRELGLKDLPIIFLTAETEHARLLELFDCGGSDYLTKPFVKEELLARILVHLERKQLTQRLRTAVTELHDLNKMKDNLIAVCSHDLRSPLHGILGFIDLMLDREYLSSEDREGLEDTKDAGMYLMELINDILDLSKIQSGSEEINMTPLNVSHLVESCYKAMKNTADSKEVKFRMIDDSKDTIISGNRSSLMRAVNNLLSNAIKFTPSGNEVSIAIKDADNNQVAIAVSDTGIGIEKKMIPELFDKYSRISRAGTKGEKGTGLGMSIVKELVQLHNGKISVDSSPEKGSLFTITLPILKAATYKAAGQPTISTEQSREHTGTDTYQILLVEDNMVNVKFTSQILERSGHKVTHAENGWAAISCIMDEEYDLILMDIEMPELDGFEASKKIRELGNTKVPIVALTGHPKEEVVNRITEYGINDFLLKPFPPQALDDIIVKWGPNKSSDPQ